MTDPLATQRFGMWSYTPLTAAAPGSGHSPSWRWGLEQPRSALPRGTGWAVGAPGHREGTWKINRNFSAHKEAKALFSSFIELWQIICVCGFYINSYK